MSFKLNSSVELPSNYKFGGFFSLIFLIASTYFYIVEIYLASYVFIFITVIFFLITIFKADLLMPLNKLWMKFGLILGMIVSPIVMGAIFFIIFTPIGALMRWFGRDELLLQFKTKPSYWTKRNDDIQSNSFERQF